MRLITDHQIKKEVDARMARDAIKQKQIQEIKDKRDAFVLIVTFVLCTLAIGFLGG